MRVLVVACLFATLVAALPEGQICFTAKDEQGLPWPLTHGRDLLQLIRHAPHCLQMVRHFMMNPPENPMDRMHLGHCSVLLRRVAVFVNETDYSVPAIICKDVLGLPHDDLTDNYAYYNWELLSVTVAEEEFKYLKAQTKTQEELFARLSGQHLGDLLMKEWNKESLTPAESAYLAEWRDEPVVRLGALGVWCMLGPDTGRILNGFLGVTDEIIPEMAHVHHKP